MKVCIDPGHGMSNRKIGVYDTGAVHMENGFQFQEAAIVLRYGLALKEVFRELDVDVFMTRDDASDHTPVGIRASMAQQEGCDVLISLHVNDVDDDKANGLEVLYSNAQSKSLALKLQNTLVGVTQMTDRKIKPHHDLAVLRFNGPCVLIELGFIAHDEDRNKLINAQMRGTIVNAIASAVVEHFKEDQETPLRLAA